MWSGTVFISGFPAHFLGAGSFVVQVHSSQWSHCCAAACTAPLLTGLPARFPLPLAALAFAPSPALAEGETRENGKPRV
jgi:hypothetical protein